MASPVRHACVLPSCEWVYTEPPTDVVPADTEYATAVAQIWRAWVADNVVMRHAQTHDVAEYVHEIQRLRGKEHDNE